jgi:predicted transcriptional regulator of viral defense system
MSLDNSWLRSSITSRQPASPTCSIWERRRAYQLAARLKEAGLAGQVEIGQYLLLGLEPELVLSNPLFIANQLVAPCYIGYWSALHFHGFSTQTPHTDFCATTRKKYPVTYRDQTYRYVLVKPHKFFGYQRERIGGLPVLVADEAKPSWTASISPAMRAA